MTLAEHRTGTAPVELVTLSIDDTEITVPEGTLVIRAAELIGIQIPRFCDHPLLDPVGACRQCLVEVEGQRKPVASCTTTVADGMVVLTQHRSATAHSAQNSVMELLLINHPLDCPVCDKGGECPLQNQAMSSARTESRFDEGKRTYPKPIPLSDQLLLDRERCVLCARCTRFSEQIAGDPFISLLERGALQQVGIGPQAAFDSYFSGNTVQICPVGALTSTTYRFRARPFDLVSTPSVCEHCAAGCAQRTDHRRGTVLRRLAGDDPQVNEEWNCDKGRWAFTYPATGNRLTTPLVRDNGTLRPASWPEAIATAARGLLVGSAGVLVGGRLTVEDSYAYSKFARIALFTNDIDFRSRAISVEETDFLSSQIAGWPMTVTYADLQTASTVVLAGLEPEDECPILYLRLRKANRTRGTSIIAITPCTTRGLSRLGARMVHTPPGGEAAALDALGTSGLPPDAVILVGERLATSPGAYTAATRLARRAGARLAWIPRRAGERGALEAGCLPSLLPGGRPVADLQAERDVCSIWEVKRLPKVVGRDTIAMLVAARDGGLDALVVGGVEAADLPDQVLAREALGTNTFVVSLEIQHSDVTPFADVVLPVAATAEKAGTFINWEGRQRPFPAALGDRGGLSDLTALDSVALEMGRDIYLPDIETARAELRALGSWTGARLPHTPSCSSSHTQPHRGQAVLATWRVLLDAGRLQEGEPFLAGTARPAVARLSPATAAEIGAVEGDVVTVSTGRGSISLPLLVTEMADRVVWVPMNSPGSPVYTRLGVGAGAVVRVEPGATR